MHDLEERDPLGLLPDLRGGHWRGFLAKYPEANRLHKRMLRVSRRLHRLEEPLEGAVNSPPQACGTSIAGSAMTPTGTGSSAGSICRTSGARWRSFLIRAERRLWIAWSTGPLDCGPHAARTSTPMVSRKSSSRPGSPRPSWIPIGGTLLELGSPRILREPGHGDAAPRRALPRGPAGGAMCQVDEAGLPLNEDERKGGVATIHGAVRVKPGIGPEDLRGSPFSRCQPALVAPCGGPPGRAAGIEIRSPPVRRVGGGHRRQASAGCTLRSEQEGCASCQEIRLAAGRGPRDRICRGGTN